MRLSPIIGLIALLSTTAAAAPITVGMPAPGLGTGTPFDVGEPSLLGRVVVLNFWASWCRPCLTELPSLDALHDRLLPAGATVLTINIDRRRPAADGVLRRLSVDLPVVYDSGGVIAALYAPAGLPATYLVDATGVVREVQLGGLDADQVTQLELGARALAGAEPADAVPPPGPSGAPEPHRPASTEHAR